MKERGVDQEAVEFIGIERELGLRELPDQQLICEAILASEHRDFTIYCYCDESLDAAVLRTR